MNPFDDPLKPNELPGEVLDQMPLDFGKFKGKSPAWIAEFGEKGESYITWAYETVERYNRKVFCSETLYRACGGKFKSAKQQREEKQKIVPYKHHHPEDDRVPGIDDDSPF